MQIIRVCPTAYVVEIIYNQRKHTENCQKTRNFRHNNPGGLAAARSDTDPQKRETKQTSDLVNSRLSNLADDLLCALLHNHVTSAREYKGEFIYILEGNMGILLVMIIIHIFILL